MEKDLIRYKYWYKYCLYHYFKKYVTDCTIITPSLTFQVVGYMWLVGGELGSLYVSGKLPTYPSPNPTFCLKWEVSVNVGLGEGRRAVSQKGVMIWELCFWFYFPFVSYKSYGLTLLVARENPRPPALSDSPDYLIILIILYKYLWIS